MGGMRERPTKWMKPVRGRIPGAEVGGERFSLQVPARCRRRLVEVARGWGVSLGEAVARMVEGRS